MKKNINGNNALLFKTILSLETEEECKNFFVDLCTVSELQELEQRLRVAVLLYEGKKYNEILEETGASSATISRVNRSLNYGADGYNTVMPKVLAILKDQEKKNS